MSNSLSDNSIQKKAEWSKDLPRFCDAAGSITAATFVGCRLPELRKLWEDNFQRGEQSSNPFDSLMSTGCKTSARHLRRRATSFAGRKRHRYPRGTKESSAAADDDDSTTNRRKRRRSYSSLQLNHHHWCNACKEEAHESDIGSIHWIPTHLWHAKRFHNQNLWGWRIPMVHTNRGSKAALRLVREGKILVHDATWSRQPISISSRNANLSQVAQVLKRIIPTFSIHEPLENEKISVGCGILHQPQKFPSGCLGQVSWIVDSGNLFAKQKEIAAAQTNIYFFVHPALKDGLSTCLRALDDTLLEGNPQDGVEGGLAYLRVIGRDAVKKAASALKASDISCDQEQLVESLSKDMHAVPITRNVLLLGNHPVDRSMPCNYGVCGVDICCPPRLAKDIFLSLVVKEGACPIGMVEITQLALECHPPLPVFPRDFPDTPVGKLYWQSSTSPNEWSLLRQYLEGGLGRIKTNKKLQQIEWAEILPSHHQESDLVMIRGSFGEPIACILSDYNVLVPTVQPKRRNRRKARNSSQAVSIRLPDAETIEQHREHCGDLLQALTLPACILANVCTDGSGTLNVGDKVFVWGQTKQHLGIITSCGFSAARGKPHGIAVVGTQRLLEAFQTMFDDKTLVRLRSVGSPDQRQARILVSVAGVRCTLAILL